MINGKNIQVIFSRNGTVVAVGGVTSDTIEKMCDLIEVSTSANGREKAYIAGKTGWELQCDQLVFADKLAQNLGLVGETLDASIKYLDTGGRIATLASGKVICTRYALTANVNEMAKGSFSFQGTGVLG